jgi:hypothetical protein
VRFGRRVTVWIEWHRDVLVDNRLVGVSDAIEPLAPAPLVGRVADELEPAEPAPGRRSPPDREPKLTAVVRAHAKAFALEQDVPCDDAGPDAEPVRRFVARDGIRTEPPIVGERGVLDAREYVVFLADVGDAADRLRHGNDEDARHEQQSTREPAPAVTGGSFVFLHDARRTVGCHVRVRDAADTEQENNDDPHLGGNSK